MDLILESPDLRDYLKSSEIIDYHVPSIVHLASSLADGADDEIAIAGRVYAYVRDEIAHSSDLDASTVTCSASEVLQHKHGICCAKAHLLAAVLRCLDIPAGFCYQWLLSDDDDKLVLHGLNALYLKPVDRWIRLDARGNKEGVNAVFSIEEEKLAWPVRKQLGEQDDPLIYCMPKREVIQVFKSSIDRLDLRRKWITR